jgi:hypothetical protein
MAQRLSRDKQLGEWALGRDEWPDRCPLYPRKLARLSPTGAAAKGQQQIFRWPSDGM